MLPRYKVGWPATANGSTKETVLALKSPAGVAVPGCHYSTPPCLLVHHHHPEALGVAEGWPCLMPAALHLSASRESLAEAAITQTAP